jgi:hypothetical protein
MLILLNERFINISSDLVVGREILNIGRLRKEKIISIELDLVNLRGTREIIEANNERIKVSYSQRLIDRYFRVVIS